MNVVFTHKAKEDYDYWAEVNPKTRDKILELLRNTAETPFKGIGKPEALKHKKPLWSRRITQEHRLVYWVEGDTVTVVGCRYHYTNI
ncbi:Txe/YoeB family addiction module toxin [Ewingella sp. S1.OA.A_B6]|uniref:Putative mRNA interferase YoeB n=1 Tax=Hafnia psychrotolerans TaxID=1477018 RepID=A0ABQ1FVK8_9GAMM|nr:Txe/YoeB family addiction module toxin [Hafnia psychrotolerans]GGA30206.1 toxin YoeB [Hafnia psychrotolerans]